MTDAPRWLLAIDSSSEQASLALFNGERIAEITWLAGRDQTATLLQEIDRLFSLMQARPAALGAVAVATGPGMFNGLRVGLSIAKGFVLALDLPLIGISTLDVAAHPIVGLGQPTLATVAAGRGRLVWAEYRTENGTTRQTEPPRNGTIDELRAHAERIGSCVVTGELTADQEQYLQSMPGVTIPPRSNRLRRASAMAEIGWQRYLRNDFDDAVALEPVYVHSTTARVDQQVGIPSRP